MNRVLSNPDLLAQHERLKNHTLYAKIKTQRDLQMFMETHVFAVWDFMSLLKRLQKDITCVTVPWKPSSHPKEVVRMINEIVLEEESDIGPDGKPIDHFTLYLNAMDEMGASHVRIHNFLEDQNFDKWLSTAEKEFVTFNLNLAYQGKIHEVASALFFGREKLIPDMFPSILKDLESNLECSAQSKFKALRYYLERHIVLDGEEHSRLAQECLLSLCKNDELKWEEALSAGLHSLRLRESLWSEVESKITAQK